MTDTEEFNRLQKSLRELGVESQQVVSAEA